MPTTLKLIFGLLADIEIPFLSRLCGGRITVGNLFGNGLGLGLIGIEIAIIIIALYSQYDWVK